MYQAFFRAVNRQGKIENEIPITSNAALRDRVLHVLMFIHHTAQNRTD
jgi:hypothetical protein